MKIFLAIHFLECFGKKWFSVCSVVIYRLFSIIELIQNVMTHTTATTVLKPVHVPSEIQNHVTRSMVLVRAIEAGKVLTVWTI